MDKNRNNRNKKALKTTKGNSEKKAIKPDVANVRLNKYIADAGVCSRREADKLIEKGEIQINGEVITQHGTKVKPGDKVTYKGKLLKGEKLKYILLNKPKGYITTSDDPLNRKTIMNLIEGACDERVYSVGRLDRNTTGLLLITNDGELTTKLTHPSNVIKKLYHVVLDKPVPKNDILKIMEGIELEDGIIRPDRIERIDGDDTKKQLGIELHSGRNRIVRRIFEHLGYEVIKLDRVMFAGLSKKDLPRGKWRFLSEKEINFLKMK
jgi:23S rRNA pseudouridine2605 synthase